MQARFDDGEPIVGDPVSAILLFLSGKGIRKL